MSLPAWLEPIRPFIAKLRRYAWSVLGLNHVLRQPEVQASGVAQPAVMGQIHMLTDRLAILESVTNWRLYGLPARVENIKLEEARILAGSGDVENALEAIASHESIEIPQTLLAEVLDRCPEGTKNLFCVGYTTNNEETLVNKLISRSDRSWIVDDPTNLLRPKQAPLYQDPKVSIVEVSVLDSVPLFERGNCEFLYFGEALNRMTTIQQTILLKRLCSSLKPGSRACFIVREYGPDTATTYWVDPRRLRPITTQSILSLIPKNTQAVATQLKAAAGCTLLEISR